MKAKKNPKVDLNKNSSLYFAIGLTLVLFLTWRALELKTYESDEDDIELAILEEEVQEEIPITEALNTPPPPPPPAAPEVIEIVDDAEEIEETVIESTETNQEEVIEKIIRVDEVQTEEMEEDIEVPFAVIEDAPVYPGCENVSKAQRRDCFNKMIQQHIKDNFKYPDIALEMQIQGRVYVRFVIDSNGKITGIQSRGPDKTLQKEAERIISLLPTMIPGKQRGRAVRVPYSVPINFKMMN